MNYLINKNKDDSKESTIPSEAISAEEVVDITSQELDKFFRKGRKFGIEPSKNQ